jgi:RNA polymerase primary sigma factor
MCFQVYTQLICIFGQAPRVQKELFQKLGRKPKIEEITDRTNISPGKVRKVLQILEEKLVSLDSKIKEEEEDLELGIFVEDTKAELPLKEVGSSILRDKIAEILNTLDRREKKILMLRFGIYDGQPKTLEEIGREFGITKERIRQIESKALDKLRDSNRIENLKCFLDAN